MHARLASAAATSSSRRSRAVAPRNPAGACRRPIAARHASRVHHTPTHRLPGPPAQRRCCRSRAWAHPASWAAACIGSSCWRRQRSRWPPLSAGCCGAVARCSGAGQPPPAVQSACCCCCSWVARAQQGSHVPAQQRGWCIAAPWRPHAAALQLAALLQQRMPSWRVLVAGAAAAVGGWLWVWSADAPVGGANWVA
jgi:hypothetical protein